MEFKGRRENNERSRVRIPERRNPRFAIPTQKQTDQTIPHSTARPSDAKLATDRELYGFDDIPVDEENMDHVRFRDIINAWMRQAIKHSPLEDKLKDASARKKRLNELKNDLKWAMQADLDEPVRPQRPLPVIKPENSKSVEQNENKLADQKSSVDHKTIDINISFGSLPKLPSPKKIYVSYLRPGLLKLRNFVIANRKIVASVALVLTACLIYSGAAPLIAYYTKSEHSNTATPNDTAQSPDYPTLLPKNTAVSELGGWKRVSPPDSNPVFAYADKINDTPISVSQQPIPNSFKPNVTDQLAELAKSFSAKNELDAGGTKIFIGTSAKGPQSAVLVKEDTLILIKAQAKISDSAWITYVQQLNKE